MLDQWKMDLESEDHRTRRDMTEKFIARNIKGETERQVTSSSTSSAVFVSDCTCIMSATAAHPSYLCSGLSNGSVCLLNTSNLSKIYLFEVDRDPRSAPRGGASAAQQLVAVATHAIVPGGTVSGAAATGASGAATGQLLLCMTLDNVVCVCPMDMSTVLERKKVSRGDVAKVKPYPSTKSATVLYSSVQFNTKGNRIVAVLGLSQEAASSGVRHCVAVLSTPDDAATLQSRFACEREWHTLVAPMPPAAAEAPPPLELCYCGWWSVDVLVCLWSNSCLQLLRAADLVVVGECRLLRHCAADAVTNATVSRPSGTDVAESATLNIVALVLRHNVAATFYVTSKRAAEAVEAPGLKRARSETVPSLSFSVCPTLQSYCSEEIPIREMHLVRSFSWTLMLLLESGALVFLDVETMRLSVHRAVHRQRMPDTGRYHTNASLSLPKHFFCVVHGRPFTAAIVEHNAAILLKAQ